jgi:hypothetical protein
VFCLPSVKFSIHSAFTIVAADFRRPHDESVPIDVGGARQELAKCGKIKWDVLLVASRRGRLSIIVDSEHGLKRS